jgi:hypothetical protein
MKLYVLPGEFSICKLKELIPECLSGEPVFFAKTGDELSLVCATENAPRDTLAAEHGWRALKLEGPLDFSLVGVLAGLTSVLADAGISIFAASTYETDYVLLKNEKLPAALEALKGAGYEFIGERIEE